MIDPIYFGIGFIIYFIFNSLTIKFCSKIPGINKKKISLLIFTYYSLLTIYVIYFIETKSSAPTFEIFIESGIIIVIGSILLSFENIEILNQD